ncbi:MAG: NAD(P)-binding domain-containing protein [Rhizomicrobium sp.]
MEKMCDVAIIGAGPYGLSLAAHLSATGISVRIFGKPLSTWRDHMPKGMKLKSEGFASNLSAPDKDSTLKAYCTERGLDYADRGLPVRLDTFIAYADWFQERFVSSLETKNVTQLERGVGGFRLTLEDGHFCYARQIVLAVGITWFKHIPSELSVLPQTHVSHSFDHHDCSNFAGRDLVVLGAGASAIDTAIAAHEAGASVRVVARADAIVFHEPPNDGDTSLLQQVQYPTSGIGPGWRSFIYANAPLLFYHLPESLRLRIVSRHLGPAPGWFTRERFVGHIPTIMGHSLKSARMDGGHVVLDIADDKENIQSITADHVIAATGYRPALRKLTFLDAKLRDDIDALNDAPILSSDFETSVDGLFAVGPMAANNFGPLMRFMVGAEFVAPRLATHLLRKIGAHAVAKAA